MSDVATLEAPTAGKDRARLWIEPATPVIGAEVTGVDLSRPLDPEAFAQIHEALLKWRVLFFRDQDLSNDALKAFGRQFGPLTPAHPISEGLDDHPEIWERKIEDYRARRNDDEARPPSARPPRDYKGWHIDITFVANPNRYSILYGVEIPPYGGDTIFSSLIAAYQGLSAPIRTLLDSLHAVHQTSNYDRGDRKPRKDGRATGPFVSLHPLVRVHPETGEKLVFFNAGTTTHIAGLKEPESQAILDLLYGEVTRPEYQVRLRWRPGTLVVWDNQAVTHAGPIDYQQFALGRTVRRITVAGDLPEGPDGFRSRPLEGELFNVIG
jgi:alpha-ketoglutarate-dependent sulfate ester dioxygenase